MIEYIKSLFGVKPAKPGGARSSKWPAVRKAHLERFPTCAVCGGTDTLEVHHVQPFHLYPHLELEESNLITLCESSSHNCHLVFGHFLSWHSFNRDVRTDAALYLSRLDKRP